MVPWWEPSKVSVVLDQCPWCSSCPKHSPGRAAASRRGQHEAPMSGKVRCLCVNLMPVPGMPNGTSVKAWTTHRTSIFGAAQTGAALAGSTKQEPIVVGKPAEFMLANIAETFGLRRDQICMVGDRLDTDIRFGQDGGLATVLTLSGGGLIAVWLP